MANTFKKEREHFRENIVRKDVAAKVCLLCPREGGKILGGVPSWGTRKLIAKMQVTF